MTTRRRQSSRPVSSKALERDVMELNTKAKEVLSIQAENLFQFITKKPAEVQTDSERKMVETVTKDIQHYSDRIQDVEKGHGKLTNTNKDVVFSASLDIGGQYVDIIDSAHATITPLIAQLSDSAEAHIDEQLKKVTGATP